MEKDWGAPWARSGSGTCLCHFHGLELSHAENLTEREADKGSQPVRPGRRGNVLMTTLGSLSWKLLEGDASV